jgi:ubiquinone/menaquinone biosynthesis C-methylase UbiE
VGERVLEIGCAEGWMTQQLVEPDRVVISGDLSFSYLLRTRSNAPQVSVTNFDAQALPFRSASFDCIVCSEVLEHVVAPFEVLSQIHRLLEPQGFLVLSVPNSMTTTRFLKHLFGQALDAYRRPTNAHLSSFDPVGISQLLAMAGFQLSDLVTSYVHFPVLSRLFKVFSPDSVIHRRLCRWFPLVGQDIILRAQKKPTNFWHELDRHYEKAAYSDQGALDNEIRCSCRTTGIIAFTVLGFVNFPRLF